MEKQSRKKITWTIKNFSSLQCQKLCSDPFVVARCKWRLCTYPKGKNVDYLFLFLEVADHDSLPCGWRRNARYSLTIINQNSVKRYRQNDEQKWFDEKTPRRGRVSMFPLNEIHAKESGYLVNGELEIVAEIEVIEVLGKFDVTEETSTITETMDVNGFQLLPSQMELVSHLLKRHPDIASDFSTKNPNLRTGYMSLLLSLIETLRQSPHQLSYTDLVEADAALESMTNAGFKLDWLEKKVDEMAEKKEKEEGGEIRVREIEEELKDLKQKCSDLEVQLEKEKLELSAANAPISFDDVM
ncbi:MATH domain and coiled-coil domain-containing protein At3g58360-like [Brassica napus]|nr:MATH domain and coiled-coil domain-containing protein At3g58360-like [Brassica napus]